MGDSFNTGWVVLQVVAFFTNMVKVKLHMEGGNLVGCSDQSPVRFLRHRGVPSFSGGAGGSSDGKHKDGSKYWRIGH